MEAEGRVARQVGGRGYFAIVCVRLEAENSPTLLIDPSAVSDYDRGLGWDEAARAGVNFGMSLSGATGAFTVTRVRGMVCDTSPTLVAIAAMRAVWEAAGYSPSVPLANLVESCLLRGHRLSVEELGVELLSGGSEPPHHFRGDPI